MYKVKQSDLKGQIKDFPIEVVQKMVEKQVHQGNKADVKVFQESKRASYPCGGFDKDRTKEGTVFWKEVIVDGNFSQFFKKYPQEKEKKELKGINLLNEFEESLKGENLKKSIDLLQKIISDSLEHPEDYGIDIEQESPLDLMEEHSIIKPLGYDKMAGGKDNPPLGVMPKFIWDRKRISMLKEAIKRYLDENKAIPNEWITEYNELVK